MENINNMYRGCIAIDLGTTNSVVGYLNEDGKEIDIPNLDGDLLTPSFIWLKEKNDFSGQIDILVGKRAKLQMEKDPTNVVCSYKTKMGLKPPHNSVKEIGARHLTAELCSSMALKYLKKSSEEFLKENITRAVITVPARFTEAQRHSTRLSAENAGLDVIRLLDEPSAAAFYYLYKDKIVNKNVFAMSDEMDEYKTVMVYDLGGGTFDVSLISIAGIDSSQLDTDGDTSLGGDNFDKDIAIWIARAVGIKWSSLNVNDQERLIRIGEKAKITISDNYIQNPVKTKSAVIDLTNISDILPESAETSITLTKSKCFKIIEKYIDITINKVKNVMERSGLTSKDLDEVLLVGGSSRFPLIREKITEFLQDSRFDMKYFSKTLVDPDKAVCYGARKYMKAVLDGNESIITTIVPSQIGIALHDVKTETDKFVVVVRQGECLPVAPRLCPLALTNIIKGDTTIKVNVLEGYSTDIAHNNFLGAVEIPIPEKFADIPNSVTFTVKIGVDVNGIVTTVVTDTTNNKKYSQCFRHEVQDSEQKQCEKIEITQTNSNDTGIDNIGDIIF